MRNQNVIALPASVNYTAEQALCSALDFCREKGLTDVIVLGYDTDGALYVRSSKLTRADGLFMTKKAEEWCMVGGNE